jgi:hypothetical protein
LGKAAAEQQKRPEGRPKTLAPARCPRPLHRERPVKGNGTRTVGGRTVRQFYCSVGTDDEHTFSVTIKAGDRPVVIREPCPPCPFHPTAHTWRAGPYGSGERARQRYGCAGGDGDPVHRFTPGLPRSHVGKDHRCPECDEFLPVHKGETGAARKHRWPLRVVVLALILLAGGKSYGKVSLWALEQIGVTTPDIRRIKRDKPMDWPEPLEPEHWDFADAAPEEPAGLWDGAPDPDEPTTVGTHVSFARRRRPPSVGAIRSRRAWRIAANWVEAFAPVIWDPLHTRLRDEALAERARLDADRAAGRPLDRPQVIVIDDVPVWGKGGRTKRKDGGFHLLVVAEVVWVAFEVRKGVHEWRPDLRLRLVRALAKSNRQAWRLVFDELGYAPDFIVADAGTPIRSAVRAHFDPATTHLVPSLWHVRHAVHRALGMTSKRAVSDPDIVAAASGLSGAWVTDATEQAWRGWWRRLVDTVRSKGLPTDKIENVRANYEDDYARVLPLLAQFPGVSLSSGGIEEKIRNRVGDVLYRRTQFANIERTNHLMDLVVAYEHGEFRDQRKVAAALRADAEARLDERGQGGFAVTLRAIDDPQPVKGDRYSSLRDPGLLDDIAAARRLR